MGRNRIGTNWNLYYGSTSPKGHEDDDWKQRMPVEPWACREVVSDYPAGALATKEWSRKEGVETLFIVSPRSAAETFESRINDLGCLAEELLQHLLGEHYDDERGVDFLHFAVHDLLFPSDTGEHAEPEADLDRWSEDGLPWPEWTDSFALSLSLQQRCVIVDAMEAQRLVRVCCKANFASEIQLQNAYDAGVLYQRLLLRKAEVMK